MLVQKRIGLLFALFLGLLAVAGARTVQLGVLSSDRFTAAAASQQLVEVTVPAPRGSITDRKGVELAVSEPAEDVSATPYLIEDPAKTARRLAPVLQVDEADLLRKLTTKDSGFVYLRRQLSARRADVVRKMRIEGIDLTAGQRRTYPRTFLASQVLGHVGTEGKGLSGLEYRFDDELHGKDGTRRRVRDGVGEAVSVRDVVPARPGKDLRLTIDAAIQDEVEQVLAGVGATYRPKGATAVVMDPRTSEVLALANWPRVNANDPAAAPGYANQNRAVGYTFEPGSTFKAFTVAGALEDGVVKPETRFDLPPKIQVADREIGESHERGPVTLSTAEILAQSSNVGAIKIGLQLGQKKFDRWMRRFGFGSRTGVALPGEERGILPRLENYSGSTMGNLPMGQGQTVTPIQLAQAYTAIANGGVLRTPQIVRSIGGERVPAPKGRRVISSDTAAELRQMLKGVFNPGGTASAVQIPGYDLAGKTGTANKVDAQTGTYSENAYISSFVGFAPTTSPRLLISVMVDEPKGAIYGGDVAAPAFGRIAAFALPYLGIAPK